MSDAWNLFARCLSIALRSYGSFVKIWLTSMLVFLVLVSILTYSNLDSYINLFTADPTTMSVEQQTELFSSITTMIWVILLLSVIYMTVVSGLSVNSFRFYLRDYQPSWIPFQFDWKTTFAYIGWSIVLGFIAFAILLIPFLILLQFGWIAYQSESMIFATLGWIVYIVGIVIAMWIVLRLANKLVGRTIGEKVSFGEAWKKTKGSAGFYISLVIFALITSWLFSIFVSLIFGLFVGIFQNSQTMLAIIAFILGVAFVMLYIFQYALFFAIGSEVYQRFFGSTKTQTEVFE